MALRASALPLSFAVGKKCFLSFRAAYFCPRRTGTLSLGGLVPFAQVRLYLSLELSAVAYCGLSGQGRVLEVESRCSVPAPKARTDSRAEISSSKKSCFLALRESASSSSSGPSLRALVFFLVFPGLRRRWPFSPRILPL